MPRIGFFGASSTAASSEVGGGAFMGSVEVRGAFIIRALQPRNSAATTPQRAPIHNTASAAEPISKPRARFLAARVYPIEYSTRPTIQTAPITDDQAGLT